MAVAPTRRSGATYLTPLRLREYFHLTEWSTRGWPLGTWALVDAHGIAGGYHWHHPLDLGWPSEEGAFAAFIPDQNARKDLHRNGVRVQRDDTAALLEPCLYTVTVTQPHRQTP